MSDLFDYAASQAAKQDGMTLAAEASLSPLLGARQAAERIALAGDGTCDADQVGAVLDSMGIPVGPWAGSIFRGGWTFTGERRVSTRVTNHGREIKVWQFTPSPAP